jgi:predicted DNA-binding transcriptional regulator YafY
MDTSTFLKRALVFQSEIKRGSFPNASTLADLCGCSRSTAMRTIDRLRYEFGVPIDYDESKRGYYLTNKDFSFSTLPPGRDELVALVLMSELAGIIDDSNLHTAIDSLWRHITTGRSDVTFDLQPLRERFSSDTTSIAKLADIDLLYLLSLCHTGQGVSVQYRSPWRHNEHRTYAGSFERVHYSDGILYGRFNESTGRSLVLNVSFIKSIEPVDSLPVPAEQPASLEYPKDHWLEGFGVWAGAKPETIEVTISAPASRYYAAQVWHTDQEDSWRDDLLVRRFPGIPSPELARRILSLGRFVVSVTPTTMLDQMRDDVHHLTKLCSV